jgi:hypothetical protein
MTGSNRLDDASSQVHTAFIPERSQREFWRKGFPAVDEEISKTGISPLWTGRVVCLPKRFSELHLAVVLKKGAGDHGAMTDASSEARKKRMLCHAKSEVIKSIRKAK